MEDITVELIGAILTLSVLYPFYRENQIPTEKSLWVNNRRNYCILIILSAMTFAVAMITAGHLVHSFVKSIEYFTKETEEYYWRFLFLFPHIAGALVCTFLGPALLHRPFRNNFPKQHRLIGKIYVFGVWFSAIIVLPLTLTNYGGPYAQLGFTTMAVLWFSFTTFAYVAARRKDFVSHRRWAMRSYAMTFAFVHVNLTFQITGIYWILGLDALGMKIMQSMVSWFMNLVIVEFYLTATTPKGKFVGYKKWMQNLFDYKRFMRFEISKQPLNR